jgi:hypothetical protein
MTVKIVPKDELVNAVGTKLELTPWISTFKVVLPV